MLIIIAMSIGVIAVITLTGVGEGARRFIVAEFASLGTNLVIVIPGKSETTGGTLSASFGGTTRDLTIADAQAVSRHSSVRRVAPIVVGVATVERGGLQREAAVLGTTNDMWGIRHWQMRNGQFLPRQDWSLATSVCVIGNKLRDELFGRESALGQWLRVGESRFRVIGVLASEGRTIGVDADDLVLVPVASAQSLFDTESLFRILVEATDRRLIDRVKSHVAATIVQRHHEDDVTVITQDAVLETFDQIFGVLTVAIAGIAAISLSVAGILIMNVMLVSVASRTNEIGVLKAIGATRWQVIAVFLSEAMILSSLGAAVGLVLGMVVIWAASSAYSDLSLMPPPWAISAAVGVALATGAVFGILPARRAADLDPVVALSGR